MNDSPGKPAFGPKNPFPAEVLERRLLNRPGSGRDTVFLRFALGRDGPSYECGDLLGVYVKNSPGDVAAFLAAAHLAGDEAVTLPRSGGVMKLSEALAGKLHFASRPAAAFIKTAATCLADGSGRETMEKLASDGELLANYATGMQVGDVFADFPSLRIPAQTLVDILPPLNPRLYSIASSPLAYPGEAHVAVSVVSYEDESGQRKGVASSYLANVVNVGERVPVFTARGKMRLPTDSRDIVMIGPGTGIAPFRAFLKERDFRGAKGRNWLFYGHRSEANDFYFRSEIEDWQRKGLLTKLSLAWSRDGKEKRYVQHLLWESRREVAAWINSGATLYICGDKTHMAADVEATLAQIGAELGKASWLDELKKEKRLQSDTY
jgi:sulfite reductase (NADPH) flavoprotein alpha-component